MLCNPVHLNPGREIYPGKWVSMHMSLFWILILYVRDAAIGGGKVFPTSSPGCHQTGINADNRDKTTREEGLY